MNEVPYTLKQINEIFRVEWPVLMANLQREMEITCADIKTQFEKIARINQILDRMKVIVNMVPSDLYREIKIDIPGMVVETIGNQTIYRHTGGRDLNCWPDLGAGLGKENQT